MSSNFNTMTKISSVNSQLLSTVEGRKEYYNFLQDHPNLKPAQVLFGQSPPSDLSEKKVIKQANNLLRHIHPDKLPSEEQGRGELMTKRVNKSKEDWSQANNVMINSNEFTVWNQFARPYEDSILDEIRNSKWLKAKNAIEATDLSIIMSDNILSLLACSIFARLGDYASARRYLPSEHQELCELLNTSWNILESQQNFNFEDAMQLIKNLHLQKSALPKTRALKEIIELLIPLECYIAQKDFFKTKDPVGYEVFLRMAIRACPSMRSKLKQMLINELIIYQNQQPYQDCIYSRINSSLAINREVEYLSRNMPNSGALRLYWDEKYDEAALSFLNDKNFLMAGLSYAKKHDYERALYCFEEQLQQTETSSERTRIFELTLDIMRYCDTLFIAEEADSAVQVIRKFNKLQYHAVFFKAWEKIFYTKFKHPLAQSNNPHNSLIAIGSTTIAKIPKPYALSAVLGCIGLSALPYLTGAMAISGIGTTIAATISIIYYICSIVANPSRTFQQAIADYEKLRSKQQQDPNFLNSQEGQEFFQSLLLKLEKINCIRRVSDSEFELNPTFFHELERLSGPKTGSLEELEHRIRLMALDILNTNIEPQSESIRLLFSYMLTLNGYPKKEVHDLISKIYVQYPNCLEDYQIHYLDSVRKQFTENPDELLGFAV